MNRTYEAMLLLDNREVKKGWQALKDDVCAVFAKHGASVKSAKRWDERRLAYPINHQLRATYLLMYLESDTQSLTAIRRDLEYSESVMRNLITVCEEVPADAFDAEEAFDESAVRVEDTGSEREAQIAGRSRDGDKKGGDRRDGDRRDGDKKDADKKDAEKKDGEAKDGEAAEGEAKVEAAEGGETEAKAGDGEQQTEGAGDDTAKKEGE